MNVQQIAVFALNFVRSRGGLRFVQCLSWLVALAWLAWNLLGGTTLAQSAVAEAPSSEAATDVAATKPPVAADGAAELGSDWVRLLHDDQGKLVGMQTAIVRYAAAQPAAGATASTASVDLIGAVHIGDRAYYDELNKLFTKYEALLYELVAPEGTVVERGRGSSNAHPVGAMQNGIKSLLELEHQLEQIDYTVPNFVHADMTPAQFMQAMKDRNEGFLQMYFRLLGTSLAQQSEMTAKGESLDFDLFSALFARDRPRQLKTVLAKQLAEMESLMVSFGGENGSVIITERNKMALKVLKEQLAAGKKNVGIFYGAGHLNDMDQRLRDDFGMKPVAITWVTAWNLAAP